MALVERVLVVVLVAASLGAGGVSAIGWWNRRKPGGFWLSCYAAVVASWVLLELVSLTAAAPELTLVGSLLANGTASLVPLTWLLFVVDYLGYDVLSRRRALALAVAFGAAHFATIATTPTTGLYFETGRVVERLGHTVALWTRGPAWFASFVVNYLLLLVGLAILARAARSSQRIWASQAALFGGVALIPTAAGTLFLFDVVPEGIPVASIASSVTAVTYGSVLRRQGLFDLSPATGRIGVKQAFDDLDAGVLVVGADGTVLEVNDATRDILGRSPATLPGSDVETALEPFGSPELADLPTDVAYDGRFYELSAAKLSRNAGYTLVIRDVTERRQREERLTVLNRVLRHNLRNDINVVQAQARQVADRLDADDLQQRLRLIEETAGDLMTLGEKARDIENAIAVADDPVETCRVDDVARNVADEFETVYPDATVSVTAAEDATVQTRPRLVEAVLEQATENGIVHDDGSSPTVEITVIGGDDGVEVTVDDHGPGIPDSEVRVLEEGEETGLNHGSGLGLWLIHWATRTLRGSVAFERTAAGSRVRFHFPNLDRTDVAGVDG